MIPDSQTFRSKAIGVRHRKCMIHDAVPQEYLGTGQVSNAYLDSTWKSQRVRQNRFGWYQERTAKMYNCHLRSDRALSRPSTWARTEKVPVLHTDLLVHGLLFQLVLHMPVGSKSRPLHRLGAHDAGRRWISWAQVGASAHVG